MKRLLKVLGWIAVVGAMAQLVGVLAGRRFTGATSPADDDFKMAGILGGSEATSTAGSLRSVGVKAILGGVALDLSEATISDGGAVMDVDLMMGGVALSVDPHWRVDVDNRLVGGDVITELAEPDSLPGDAPRLTLRVRGRWGGVAVSGT